MCSRLLRPLFGLLLLFFLCSFNVQAVQMQRESSLLIVRGEVEKPLQLSLSELSKLPRRTVRAKNHDGKECSYEGVELREILIRAGVKFGKELKGRRLASFVLVEAADKYQVVFALPELDSLFTDRVILLADVCDGEPLSDSDGPLQIIAPDEKRHARWVRQVTSLTILHGKMEGEGAKRQ